MGKDNPAAQGNGETAAAFGTGTGEYKILMNNTGARARQSFLDGCRVRVFLLRNDLKIQMELFIFFRYNHKIALFLVMQYHC